MGCSAASACSGIEYNANGHCEVWSKKIEASVSVAGYTCLQLIRGAAMDRQPMETETRTTSTISSTITPTNTTTTSTYTRAWRYRDEPLSGSFDLSSQWKLFPLLLFVAMMFTPT